MDFLLRQLGCLLGRQHHVAVVGEHEHAFGVHRVDGTEDIVNGGVHGLTALDDMIHRQITEDLAEALAQGHGHHAEFLLRLCGGFLLGRRILPLVLTALLQHVLNLQVDQLAQLQSVFKGVAGVVGMHMHLHQGHVPHHHHAVANAVEAAAEGVHIVLVAVLLDVLDGELRAVGKLDFAQGVVVVLEADGAVLLHGGGGVGDFLAPHHRGIAGVDQQQAPSAGVHHAGLLEGRQHVGGALEDGLAAPEHDGHQRVVIVGILLHLLEGVLGNHAGHGEDGALLGLHHGLVGLIRTGLEGVGELDGGNLLHTAERLGKAAQQLGGNHAGIAPGALERALGQGVRGLVRTEVFLAGHLPGSALHGQGHVGAGIAVRHGEHVQRVHRLTVLFEQGRAGNHHIAQQQAVNRLKLNQGSFPPFTGVGPRQTRMPSTEILTLRTFTPVMLSSL